MHKLSVKIAANAIDTKIPVRVRSISLTAIITFDGSATFECSQSQQLKKEPSPRVKLFTVELAKDLLISSWPTILEILSFIFYSYFTL